MHEAIARRGGGRGDMSTLVQSVCLGNLYCIARNFGEELNLAVYLFNSQIKTPYSVKTW